MLKHIASVSGMTLLSRAFGFMRDLVLANVLGAGPLADAFFVAFRLPNHFRAIFADGAFNAAFIPTFAKVTAEKGRDAALLFADRIFALLFYSQLVFLGLVLLVVPWIVRILAPGLVDDAIRFPLAVELTRITFPYLAFMALVIMLSGILNSIERFAAAAATAILLNVAMIIALLMAGWFPTTAHAAAWGVVVSGLLQFLLVAWDALRHDVMVQFRWPRIDAHVKRFWNSFVPATLGAAGFQIALFADTIIASFLPQGVISALYYADRINQLPIGVIGIAVGTVLLADMSRRIAEGDEAGAKRTQMRAVELTLLFTLPCIAAFLLLPEVIIRALFFHGAFTANDGRIAGQALAAYGVGLLAFMLLRTVTITFHARGDTRTPVIAMGLAVAVNIALKLALIGPLQHIGLALATSIGSWVNVGVLVWLGWRRGLVAVDERARRTVPRLLLCGFIMVIALVVALTATDGLANGATGTGDRFRLLIVMLAGGISYGGMLIALFGREWLDEIKRLRRGHVA